MALGISCVDNNASQSTKMAGSAESRLPMSILITKRDDLDRIKLQTSVGETQFSKLRQLKGKSKGSKGSKSSKSKKGGSGKSSSKSSKGKSSRARKRKNNKSRAGGNTKLVPLPTVSPVPLPTVSPTMSVSPTSSPTKAPSTAITVGYGYSINRGTTKANHQQARTTGGDPCLATMVTAPETEVKLTPFGLQLAVDCSTRPLPPPESDYEEVLTNSVEFFHRFFARYFCDVPMISFARLKIKIIGSTCIQGTIHFDVLMSLFFDAEKDVPTVKQLNQLVPAAVGTDRIEGMKYIEVLSHLETINPANVFSTTKSVGLVQAEGVPMVKEAAEHPSPNSSSNIVTAILASLASCCFLVGVAFFSFHHKKQSRDMIVPNGGTNDSGPKSAEQPVLLCNVS